MTVKKKSKRKGGGEAEKIAKAFLETQGWTVHRATPQLVSPRPGTFFVLTHDVWGAIDLAAMHPARGFLFVQVTSARAESGTHGFLANVRTRRKKVEALPWPTFPVYAEANVYRVQVWALRAIKRGRLVSRYFQIWDFDVQAKTWKLLPDRIAIGGTVRQEARDHAKSSDERPGFPAESSEGRQPC